MKDNKSETLELKEKLVKALGENAEYRILVDPEDRYVYSFGKVFLERDPSFSKEGRTRPTPDLIVKAKSLDEVNLVRKLSLENGFIPVYEDIILNPVSIIGKKTVLIDFTERLHPPTPKRRMPDRPLREELLPGGVRLVMNSVPDPIPNSNTIPLKMPCRSDLPEKCKEHSPCKGYCPIGQTVYDGIETFSSKGRYIIARGVLRDEIKLSKKVSDILYSCSTCGNCFRNCTEYLDKLYKASVDAKRRLIEKGMVPPTIKDSLESTAKYWNPWGLSQSRRNDWMKDLDFEIPVLKDGDSTKILLYVGCTPSYDSRAQEIVKSLAKILIKYLDLEVGILGNNERCCGHVQRAMGEEGLFELLVKENSKIFNSIDFETLLTICPHCYDTFKNEYPEFGVELNPIYYTEFLEQKINGFKFSSKEEKIITYHDSCYLDRHNDIHESPRKLLRSLPDLKFVDIESGTQCCGGAVRMWFEDPFKVMAPAQPIIESALDVEANILAVACPFCLINFEDTVKVIGAEEKLVVKEISELICSSLDLTIIKGK